MQRYRLFIAEIYSEPDTSTFTHEGSEYDLNGLLSATVGAEPINLKVESLTWILKWDPMTAKDELRIQNADLQAPILVTHTKDGWVVLDGIHRLVKAQREHAHTIKAVVVSPDLLARYQSGKN